MNNYNTHKKINYSKFNKIQLTRKKKNELNKNTLYGGTVTCTDILGKGNFGVVYKCKNIDDTECAIKFVRIVRIINQLVARQFIDNLNSLKNEISIYNYINDKRESNPNSEYILYYISTFPAPEESFIKKNNLTLHYMATELCNTSIFDLIIEKKLSLINFSQSIEIIYQIWYGLYFLYTIKIIHMDIKPENILFNSVSKKIKISDFGTACNFDKLQIDNKLFNPNIHNSFESIEELLPIYSMGTLSIIPGKNYENETNLGVKYNNYQLRIYFSTFYRDLFGFGMIMYKILFNEYPNLIHIVDMNISEYADTMCDIESEFKNKFDTLNNKIDIQEELKKLHDVLKLLKECELFGGSILNSNIYNINGNLPETYDYYNQYYNKINNILTHELENNSVIGSIITMKKKKKLTHYQRSFDSEGELTLIFKK